MFTSGYFVVVCGAFIGMLLLASGIAKLVDLVRFEAVVRGFELLPRRIVPAFARIIPGTEILLGLACLLGAASRQALLNVAALGAAVLFLLFLIALAVNLLRGRRKISCGCFGADADTGISWLLVWRNGLLVSLSAVSSGLFFRIGIEGRLPGIARLDAALVALAVLLSWQLSHHALKLSRYARALAEMGWKV